MQCRIGSGREGGEFVGGRLTGGGVAVAGDVADAVQVQVVGLVAAEVQLEVRHAVLVHRDAHLQHLNTPPPRLTVWDTLSVFLDSVNTTCLYY